MQEDLVNGITEREAAERLGLSKEWLKKKRLAGEVNRTKYAFFQGYIYSEDISREDLEGRMYVKRGQERSE